jgi:hypothetical protein
MIPSPSPSPLRKEGSKIKRGEGFKPSLTKASEIIEQ